VIRAVRLSVLGGTVVTALALAVGFGRGGWEGLRRFADEAGTARTPAGLVAPLCAIAAAALLGWLGLGALLTALTRLPGPAGRHASAGSLWVAPAVLRAGVAAALGGSLALAATPAATPARSQPAAAAPQHAGRVEPAAPSWSPGPPPTRPMVGQADVALVSSPAGRGRASDERVVVRRGDSLWTIAARHLPPGADDADIARAWPRWYAANRAVVGDDPDRLRPGQLLVRPPDT
jgi:nucleoid-associated protein YgaU